MAWRPSTALAAIGDHEVTLIDVLSHRAQTQPADTVVIVTNGVPDASLFTALDGHVAELARVGDAVSVRPVDRAVYDGHRAGRAI
jgi:N-acetylglucosamine kinase-like BadF-type ATPase